MLSNRLLGGVAFATLLAAAPAAYAQQTTAAVRGVAQSESGAPIGGATITVLHVPTGTRTTVKTDAKGVFDVRGLQVGGPYDVTAAAPGMTTEEVTGIYLAVGDADRLTLVLKKANQVAEVVVTATRAGATSQLANVGSRTTLKRAEIETVVSPKRDIRDVARRDPLASLDLVNRSTGPSGGLYIAGSSPRRNRITIDGVRSQDDYGLNTGGLSTNRGPVSLEALEQVTIQAVPFDVEDGDFTGGALNLVLRSGTNNFHGTLFDFVRNRRWIGKEVPKTGFVGNDVTAAPLTGYKTIRNYVHEDNYGFFLGGPILKDRLFFAVSYERFDSNDLTGFGPAGLGFANSFAPIPGVSTGPSATAGDIATVLSNFNSYAASKALSPGQVDLVQPIKDEKSSIKLDYYITDGQHLTATYRHAFSSVTKRSPNLTSISLDTNWYSQPENEDNYALQLNSRWTPQLSTEARISYRAYQRGQQPPEGQGFAQISVCTDPNSVGSLTSCSSGVPTINFGPDQFRQANVLKTTDWAGQAVANYRFGGHLIKGGYQFKGIHVYNLFLQAAKGVYYFDSVSDFANGKANSLAYGDSLDGVTTDAAARFSYNVHTFFLQDTWDITPALTLNVGLRDDAYASDSKPTLNTNFVGRYGYSNQTTYDGINVLMPRASFKWRQRSFVLSGGIGLVSGGIPDVFLGNSFGGTTGALTNSFAIVRRADGSFFDNASNTVIDPATGSALLNINKADPSFAQQQSATAKALLTNPSASRRLAYTNSIAPGFDMPSDWKANLSLRTTQFGVDFGIDAVASWSETNIAFRDIRSRRLTINGVQQYTPDGRIRYDGLNVDAATRTALGLPVATNPDLTNIGSFGDIQAYNPSKGNWAETVAFSVGKAWRGLRADVSYTLQNASAYGGFSEFGTTEGGNASNGNLYADQTFSKDPNGAAKGKSPNLIKEALKFELSYKMELKPGWQSRFTLFGEDHSGRPFSFLMTDPATGSGARSPVFGVFRDDALAYAPNLANPDPANPLKFTTGTTTVFFDSPASLAKFKALAGIFHLPSGAIVPRGFGENPRVTRLDFQYAQDLPSPVPGHKIVFTADFSNIGNMLNKHWGQVKEYTGARNGGALVNVQCADAAGVAQTSASAVCTTYRYSYTNVNPLSLATPTVDQLASVWSVQLGLKYKF